jgi:hypothetical protein
MNQYNAPDGTEKDTYVVVAAHLDTVADTSNTTVGEGDTAYTAVLGVGGTAVQRLVIATVVGLLDRRLRSLGSLWRRGRLEAARSSESTSGDGEDGEDGELHVVGLESVGLGKESMRM